MPLINLDNTSLAELRKLDPDFDAFMAGDEPAAVEKNLTVADVHVSSAGSNKKGTKKPLTFLENVGAEDDMEKAIARTFAEVLEDVNNLRKSRTLRPHEDGGAHVPFPHDINALGQIPPAQVRRFLTALTTPDDLEQRRVPMNSLVSVQPRISPEKVESMRSGGFDKLPTVVRHNGKNLLVDGSHRAAAQWLDGDNMLDCKYCALRGEDESIAKDFGFHILSKSDTGVEWEFNFEIKKADEDEQLIFGWASIVQEGDQLVIDHQDDVMMPGDLEKGAYDFVLEARQHGHGHKTIGTGRLVESMMFTKEKQEALGVIVKNQAGQQIVGWWVGFKVDDAGVWKMHKNGELPEFSIGGHSSSIDLSKL